MRRRSRSACSGPHLDEVAQLRARALAERQVVRETDGLDVELREARDRSAGLDEVVAEQLMRRREPAVPHLEDVAAEEEPRRGRVEADASRCVPGRVHHVEATEYREHVAVQERAR